MAGYEVFVSDLWPGHLKESDFDPYKYKNNVKENDKIGLIWGCILFFASELIWYKIVEVFFFPLRFKFGWIQYFSAAGLVFFPILIIKIANYFIVNHKATGLAGDARRSEISRREYMAKSLSEELNGILNRSQTIVRNLPQYISNAYYCLRISEQEFNENAFSPFWDQIEKATRSLENFYNDVRQICWNAKEYTMKLQGKLHNFPVFIYDLEAEKIDPAPIVNELNRIVRKGQTNFQFATIFEQKKTQKILIMGFQNLSDAINNLSYSMASSINELTASISNDIQRVSRSVSEDIGRLSDQSEDHFRRQSNINDEQFKRQSRLLTEQLHHAEQTKDNLERIARKLKAY